MIFSKKIKILFEVGIKGTILLLLALKFSCIAHSSSSASYGLSIHGKPKYSAAFSQYDYVNPNAPQGGEFKMSISGSFDSFNGVVLKGNAAAGISSLLHVTLMSTSHEEPSTCYGYLAESVEANLEQGWVIFKIRPQAKFHNGSAITAEDVIYSFNSLRKEGLPLYKSYYKDVKSVEKLDPLTVKFNLNPAASQEIPVILGQFPIFSRTYFQKNGFASTALIPPLGSGPYKICDFKAGHFVKYERVKNWWGADLPVNKGRYNFDFVRYEYFRDDQVAFEAFKNHLLDIRIEVSAKNWQTGYNFEAFLKGKVIKESIPDLLPSPTTGLFFNTRRPLFSSIKVRQALTEVFNFDWLNKNIFYTAYQRTKSYFDHSLLACSGIPQGKELALLEPYRTQLPPELFSMSFHLPEGSTSSLRRAHLRKAKNLLKEAGWVIQNNKLIHEQTGEAFSFVILLHNSILEKAFQNFIQDLKQLGIQARLQIVDSAQYTQRVTTRDFDMVYHVIPQSPSPGNEQQQFWGSQYSNVPGSMNIAGINNPVVDQLIKSVIEAKDREELQVRVRALDRALLWNYYIIPGWQGDGTRVAYWNCLKRPEKSPEYGIDLFSWWIEPSA